MNEVAITSRELRQIQQLLACRMYRLSAGALERRCPTCRKWKPYTLSYFYRRRKSWSGLNRECQRCNRQRAQGYFDLHRSVVARCAADERMETDG